MFSEILYTFFKRRNSSVIATILEHYKFTFFSLVFNFNEQNTGILHFRLLKTSTQHPQHPKKSNQFHYKASTLQNKNQTEGKAKVVAAGWGTALCNVNCHVGISRFALVYCRVLPGHVLSRQVIFSRSFVIPGIVGVQIVVVRNYYSPLAGLGICSFAHLLICSSLFCSKSLRLKSDCERFAQVAYDKRVTLSQSLASGITKEQP